MNYEIVRALVTHNWSVRIYAVDVSDDLRNDVEWTPFSQSWAPSDLLRNQVFACQTALRLRGDRGLIHANGFVTWRDSHINTAHFVHSAWLNARGPVIPEGQWQDAYYVAYARLNSLLEKRAFAKANVVVAVSGGVENDLVRHAGVAPGKIRVIPNGVDPAEFRPRLVDGASLGLHQGRWVVLFVGDLKRPIKNLDTVLQAVRRLPEVYLAVVGDHTASRYPAMVDRLGLADRVTFLGYRRDVSNLMAAASACVVVAHYEPFGLVVREAMSSGIPVVVATSVGSSRMIVDGRNGLLLEDESDANALAHKLEWLRTHPQIAQEIGVRAREAAMTWTWREMGAAYLDLYEEVLGGPLGTKSFGH